METIIRSFEIIQSTLAIYLLFILIKYIKNKLAILLYLTNLFLFISLKFRLISYTLGWLYDRFLWGSYNLTNTLFIIYIMIILYTNKKWK